jgi:hypothetical protein
VSIGYRSSLAATGGVAPYRWKIVSGSLPAGLVFNESAGVITGIPEVSEGLTLGFEVTDSTGATAFESFALTIASGNWGTTYCVDNAAGNGNNFGTSASAPWKTLARVNRASFAPGNRVLLKRGEVWREELNFPSSGLPGDPILVDAYGSDNAPVISGADLISASMWKDCSSCQQYVWEASVKTQPSLVLFNGVKGKHLIASFRE